MSENNKTYRIRTTIGNEGEQNLTVMLDQDYDNFEILSLNISRENAYKMHTSNYGCIAGRVLANGAYGIPNAKISVFIPTNEDEEIDPIIHALYPYETTLDKNSDKIRYNTLPDEKISKCHQAVGTFPNKRLVLDDNNVLEVYDKYYKYNAVSNEAGDYMIFGVPTGEHTVHVDIDLSDIGDLSQTPRDMIFKGYNINQFESPSMFKSSTELDTLTQIISQDSSVFVNPFWGDDTAENISITRNDIDIKYKFEPTCVFIGSLVTDGGDNGFSQKCVPTKEFGTMNQLVGGSGTIEMIRKTPEDDVESFVIHGTKLIDGNGTWCYQIPMNLDYMGTDEYGNTVPTNDPNKGIPTRTRVRFRISLTDSSSEYVNRHLAKVLVPNNPQTQDDLDYAFGTYSKDDEEGSKSYRDLFTNNVYTVKSYIPRIQKSNAQRNEHFSGFKNVSVTNGNNPLPYNNMRVNLTFMFVLQCALLKILIRVVRIVNKWRCVFSKKKTCIVMGDGICPDLEGWYFAPGCKDRNMTNTLKSVDGDEEEGKSPKNQVVDTKSVDSQNNDSETMCITSNIDYLMQCVEINLAMENSVIKFDFYNDWINGMIYIPHWYGNIKKKRTYLFGLIKTPEKVHACMENTYKNSRKFVQQCALSYGKDASTGTTKGLYTVVTTHRGCRDELFQKCHTAYGRKYRRIMGKTGGLVHDELTFKQEHVYYFRPCEWLDTTKKYPTRCILFATDIVMLGSLNEYNRDGIPSAFNDLTSTSFKLPGNLVSTNLETDTPLYTIDDGSLCINSQPESKDGVHVGTNYSKYAKNTPDWTNESDDDEYKLSEMSGIDWGFSGPGQGKNSLRDLYFPGGHFLGISCFNPETNIKSCVNLSRACEIGVNLSQYQETVSSIDKNGNFHYLRRSPNGLISKYEINDSNFRNIFATLNFNGLRTKKDKETNYRQYDFVTNMSFNFDGALSTIVNADNASYTEVRETHEFKDDYTDSNNVVKLFSSTIEEANRDYYLFRFGLADADTSDEQLLKSKYLINDSDAVSLPMYSNSLYFYFGIKEGQTAYDRFLDEFYAVCPDEALTIPSIELGEIINTSVCGNSSSDDPSSDGSVSVEINGLGSAYKIRLYKKEGSNYSSELKLSFSAESNTIYVVVDSGGTKELASQYKRFTIGKPGSVKGLGVGDYRLSIVTLSDSSEYTKDFHIDMDPTEYLTEFMSEITTVDFNQELSTNKRHINNLDFGGSINFHIAGIKENEPGKYIVENCEVSSIDIGNVSAGGLVIYLRSGFTTGKQGRSGYYITVTDDTISVYVPYGNVAYELGYGVYCGIIDSSKIFNDKTSYFIAMPTTFDYYFGTIGLPGKKVRKQLGITVNTLDNVQSGDKIIKWYESDKLSGLTETELWLLEKTLIFDTSMFDVDENSHSIPLGMYGGTLPYTTETTGHGERIEMGGMYTLTGRTEDGKDGFVVDYKSFNFPTYYSKAKDGWPDMQLKHIKKLKELSLIKKESATALSDYKLVLKDAGENYG